ncbi:Cytolethal distending toxin subunit B [Hyalangium minutum]|uniref:Cytolethal distending toxin subunit B n=2 Tax=Hyalangium minutum TaxID=394096 RepID=A0A085WPQ9_9BACT|nr:Cytolethal distending toxin subunit B [Hyalangium minutum]
MQYGRDRWSHVYTLSERHDVIAIQEAPNEVPSAATPTQRNLGNIVEYRWRESDRHPERFLYFLPQPSRNLAVVTRWQATAAAEIQGPYRAMLAVVHDNELMFASAHASANGGGDAASLLQRAAQHAQQNNWRWAVLGDFNRDPANLQRPANTFLYRSGLPTQRSGGELDYMVSDLQTNDWHARVGGNSNSDHWPVQFGALRAGAQARLLHIHSDNNDRFMDVDRERTDNGTRVISYHATGNRNQQWFLAETGYRSHEGKPLYRIVSADSLKCLDVDKGPRGHRSDYFNIWDCHPPQGTTVGGPHTDTQNFTLEHPVADQPNLTMLRHNATGLYANILSNVSGDGGWVGLYDDQSGITPVPNETFYLHPIFLPSP